MLHAVDFHVSTIIMADKKTNLEVIKSEIEGEPQSSEEPYKTYTVKEEDLEDDWTENDAKEVSEEQQSPDTDEKCLVKEDYLKEGQQGEEVHRRFHIDSVQEADSEDGWTEDDDAKETEAQQSKEADHQTFSYFIKEEPVESDSADDDDGTALQATSQSCSKQGGDSSLQSSYQSMRNTQEMLNDRSCDGAGGPSLPGDFPLEAGRGTQSDSSERESCPSEYDSCLIPSQVPYFHEKHAADRETLHATTSSHEPGGMDKDRNEDITMEYDEMINQSSQLRATGSDQNDPSCSLAKEKPFLCCICSKGFALRTRLSRHMRAHEGEKPHECMLCSKRFMYINSLKEHLRIHTGEKPHRCTVCDKGFRASRNLAQHMTDHTGKNRYECKFCNKKYTWSNGLQEHMRTHTGEKPYQCKLCDKKYSQSSNLGVHMRTHTGEEPYQCKFCDKKYSHRSSLGVHMRTHTGEKPYKCSFCTKTFSRTSNVSRHIKVHTGERPFECSVCKKTFSQTQHLSTHLKIHTGEKPFKCSFCSKTFSEQGYLTEHLKVHTGEKPYLCSVCGKSFSRNTALTDHMTIHTGEKPFTCSVCDISFRQKRNCKKHMKTHT